MFLSKGKLEPCITTRTQIPMKTAPPSWAWSSLITSSYPRVGVAAVVCHVTTSHHHPTALCIHCRTRVLRRCSTSHSAAHRAARMASRNRACSCYRLLHHHEQERWIMGSGSHHQAKPLGRGSGSANTGFGEV